MPCSRRAADVATRLIFLETVDHRFVGGPAVADTHRLLEEMGYRLVADLDSDRLYVFDAASQAARGSRRAA